MTSVLYCLAMGKTANVMVGERGSKSDGNRAEIRNINRT